MSMDLELATAYKEYMNGLLVKDYAEQCEPESYHDQTDICTKAARVQWYLPHFGVYHPQKHKLKIVHDAAAANKGVSYNSLLLTGPDLLKPLLSILFKFREGRVAVTGDIREMFPRIKIREADRDAQRFLWRTDPNEQVKEFRMSSMIFGAVSSPCTALFIKNKNALSFSDEFLNAVNEIIENHYMDDYISSMDDADTAATLTKEVFCIHQSGGFEMRAWVSNDYKALSQIPKGLGLNTGADVNLPSHISTLGIKWTPREDTLGFRTGFRDGTLKHTKRTVLSQVMRVYDPLGLLSPVIIKGRIFIQRLWREGADWDGELQPEHVPVWQDWLREIALVTNLRIPRWYMHNSVPEDKQLHIFADASEDAFACVAYWRVTYADGNVKLALIGSKARVAPLKPTSIPRLELQAALIASRWAKTNLEGHRWKPSATVFWTDSITVLKWLKSDARCYVPFVAHRISEISENSNLSDWRWVPGFLNVADDATKLQIINLHSGHRWFTGPPFLLNLPKEWPEQPPGFEDLAPTAELKGHILVNCLLTPNSELVEHNKTTVEIEQMSSLVPNPLRFSKWLRLLRATACVIRASKRFRSLIRPTDNLNSNSQTNMNFSTVITVEDINQAEKLILKRSQFESFNEEIKLLKAKSVLPKISRLPPLSPLIASDGFLRIDSRIKATRDINEESKSLIILDGRNHIVRLLIMNYHINAGHGFPELILNELRQKFWILRARDSIRNVGRQCLKCKRTKAQPVIPPTGDLPLVRLEHHVRPFTNTGLDYFGPVDVTVGRHHKKRYVALYTCMVSRAVHLEVVASLTTDSAIMALRRFISRRGCPSKLLTDNGTAFVGASRELAALYGKTVENFATNNKIQWTFIPPVSPFMGGAWERMVRSVKTALRGTLSTTAPKEEVLQTFLLEAEAIVNSRPLTYIPVSPSSPEAITPFHFLIDTSSTAPWLGTQLSDEDLLRRSHWKRTLRLADHFWNRWVKEYLPTIMPRRGSPSNFQIPKEGDIVLVCDPSLPRGVWPLGRIVQLYPGQDGIARVADVQTKGGTLKRPLKKLVPLLSEL